MLITTIKKKIFELITRLGYTVKDTPESENDTPWIKLSLATVLKQYLKDGSFIHSLSFRLDVFSDYNGEAEILEIEDNITSHISEIYELPEVLGITTNFRIIDDKSTGVVNKHGIITYNIIVGGKEQEVEDETDTSGE